MSASTLNSPLRLSSGVVLPNRLVMAPMVVQGSDPATGSVTEEDLEYFRRRSQVAGMLITGAAYVERAGRGFGQQLSIAEDSDPEGLQELASVLRADGAKALVQLHHAGREAPQAHAEFGRAVAPSTLELDWLPFVPQGMTAGEVRATIVAFGAATRRALEAGFDGVEIHGANHYLIQQFFSAFSNRRDDEWGGDLEHRMAFPLAVLDEVKRVAAEADRPFAVGYRLIPEEIHGDTVGFTIEDTLQLVDRIAARGVDYLHISLFSGFASTPEGSEASYGQVIRDRIAGRCPVIIVSDVLSEQAAVDALEHGDLVAVGRAALMEPQFAKKIADGRGDELEMTVAGHLHDLDLPAGLITWYTGSGRAILPPLPGLDQYMGPQV